MQRDTTFIAPLAAALFALGSAAVISAASPTATPARTTAIAAQAAPVAVTLPTVVVIGQRATRVAAGEPVEPSRLQ